MRRSDISESSNTCRIQPQQITVATWERGTDERQTACCREGKGRPSTRGTTRTSTDGTAFCYLSTSQHLKKEPSHTCYITITVGAATISARTKRPARTGIRAGNYAAQTLTRTHREELGGRQRLAYQTPTGHKTGLQRTTCAV